MTAMIAIEPTPAQLNEMRDRSEHEKRPLTELLHEFYSDQIVCDVFQEDAEEIQSKRDQAARLETEIEHLEAGARGKATEFRKAVQRRDILAKSVQRAGEQLAQTKAARSWQDERLDEAIGDVGNHSLAGEEERLIKLQSAYLATAALIPRIEKRITSLEKELVEATAAVAKSEKGA